ncbi:MAG: metallophosphoesterase [Bryobacteraceae bacterium]|nr:metallophosphoesterase [Bryobacteraceae bacterium]
MPNIRWVCLSDLHLGEEDSLLTHVDEHGTVQPEVQSPVLRRLAACVHELVAANEAAAPRPDLILNGDLLELALAGEETAASVFVQCLAALAPGRDALFGEIICVPGNHDHHLWETAREAQYLNYVRRQGAQAPLEAPWHTTKVFMDMQGIDRLSSDFLNTMARRLEHLERAGTEILIAYPNYGIRSAGDAHALVFHHGHFIEPLYRLMSTATSLVFPDKKMPATVYALEEENFAWIDFFWSAMGRQGEAGAGIERIYEATTDEKSLRALTDRLARSLAQRYDIPYVWPTWLEEQIWRTLFRQIIVRHVAGKQERQQTEVPDPHFPLSEASRKELRWYVEQLLVRQMQEEAGVAPQSLTFVIGHTHKPFQVWLESSMFPAGLTVLNTGGWVVESLDPEPLRGAAVVLVDEELHAVSVRLYNEGRYEVHVEEATPPGRGHSQFWERIRSRVASNREPWKSFAETVAREVVRRQELLRRHVRGR